MVIKTPRLRQGTTTAAVAMALIWQWAIIVLAMLAASTNSESVESCAMPLTVTRSITFRVPVEGNDVYNDTEYRFDGLVCKHVSYNDIGVERYESLTCKTGNITHSGSKVTEKKHIDQDINHVNGLICRTKKQPNVMPNSTVHFSCEIGEHYGFHCNASNYCLIEPVSLYQRSQRNSEEWQQLLGYRGTNFIRLEGGYGFECPEPLVCYWQTCSSVLITSKEWDADTDPQLLESSLQLSLEGILKTPSLVTSLEITKTNISNLPDIICQFKSLRRLVLVHNNLAELPDCLNKMSSLEILDASFNALRSIHKIFFGSDSTQSDHRSNKYLDLSFNKITHIEKDALKEFKSVFFLSLSNNSLTKITFDFPRSLHHLDLSHNNIEYFRPSQKYILSEIFDRLKSIRTLSLQHNNIESPDFYIPKTLISLDLSHNQIPSVKEEMFVMASNLQTLSLENNRIYEISFDNHRNLKSINLRNNNMENLDFLSRSRLTELETLDLSYNNITSINLLKEETILPKIINMNLSHNQLRVAPLNLIFLKQLRTVDFSHNQIETCTWSNLGYDDIIKNIDDTLNGFCMSNYNHHEDKSIVNLEHNRIKSLKDVFGQASIMLRKHAILFCHLKLHHNPFHCDCHMFSYLNELSIYNWNNDIMATSCSTPTQLKSRSIFDRKIVDTLICDLLPEQNCKFIYKPSEKTLTVNCSNLNLTKCPLTDETLRSELEKSAAENDIPEGININIYLNGNNLSNIIHNQEKTLLPVLMDIGIKTHIKILDMSHSHINEIDDMYLFHLSLQLTNLTQLHLNDNNLTTLPLERHIFHFESATLDKDYIVPFWDKVNELHLYNNPWDCSCEARWMKKWLNNLIERKILVRPNEIKCVTPNWNHGKIVHTIENSDFCTDPRPSFVFLVVLTALIAIVLWKSLEWMENRVHLSIIVQRKLLAWRDQLIEWRDEIMEWRENRANAPIQPPGLPTNLLDENDPAPLITDNAVDDNDRLRVLEPSTSGRVQVRHEIKPLALNEESEVMKVENDEETRELLSGNDKVDQLGRDDDVVCDDLKLTTPTRVSEENDADRENLNDDDDDITVLSTSTDSALDEETAISFGRQTADDNRTIPETLSKASKVDDDDIVEMKLDVFASFSKKGSNSNT